MRAQQDAPETEKKGTTKTDKDLYRQRQIKTDRDKQTDRPTDRQTDKQTDRERETDRQRDRQTDRETDRQTDRQRDRETDRQIIKNQSVNGGLSQRAIAQVIKLTCY